MYLSRSLQTLLWMAAAILKSKPIFWKRVAWKTLPKAQRTRGLSCAEVNAFLKHPNLTPKRFNKLQLQSFGENLLQNLDKTSLSISWQIFRFKISTKPSINFKILNQTVFYTRAHSQASTSATLTTSRRFELASSKARVASVKSTKKASYLPKQEWGSQSVSYWQG